MRSTFLGGVRKGSSSSLLSLIVRFDAFSELVTQCLLLSTAVST